MTMRAASPFPSPAPRTPLARDMADLLVQPWALPAVWRERSRARRQLALLPDHLLADIGLDRARVARECRKPFFLP